MKRKLSILVAALIALSCLGVAAPALADASPFASTPLGGSSNKTHNVELAAAAIDGTVLYYGDTFSFNDVVGPRKAAYGYRPANNGRGVNVVGGGVAQVATTLHLALMQMDDIEYVEFRTYGDKFSDDYVSSGYDAVLTDYETGIDFSFTSYYSGTISISMWTTDEDVNCLLTLDGGGSGAGDLVGSASTQLYGTDNKLNNIALAMNSITGLMLESYDVFSFNDLVGPRTTANGYRSAVNGRGVNVVGGGVAQVASTVYLAVKYLDNVEILEKKTYGSSFTEGYVDDIDDAIVTDYNAGTDFSFQYVGSGQLTIYLYEAGDELYCEVYES